MEGKTMFSDKNREELNYAKNLLEHIYKKAPFKCIKIQESNIKQPDIYFEIDDVKGLIEVKKLLDEKEIKISAVWSHNVNELKARMISSPKYLTLNAYYLIDSTDRLNVKVKSRDSIANQLLDSILSKKKKIKIDNYEFKIYKITNKENGVSFGGHGEAGAIDANGIMFKNLISNKKKSLVTANEQLGNYHINTTTKKLLIVDLFKLGGVSNLIKVLSIYYEELLSLSNIDEIWFLQKDQFTLVYEKNFLINLMRSGISNPNEVDINLFEKWFYALIELETKNKHIIITLKSIIKAFDPWTIFKDIPTRCAITKFAEYLINNKNINDGVWLINKFYNDPSGLDISIKNETEGKIDINLNIFNSVQGYVAWSVKELSRKSSKEQPKYLIKAFQYTNKKLENIRSDKYYLTLCWLQPLIEISNRRLWILKKDVRLYKKYRDLILNQETGLVAKFAKNIQLRKDLIHIFNYFKDLTDNEAYFVIDQLIDEPEVASILVYFALYRERHYKKQDEVGSLVSGIDSKLNDFNSEKLKTLLIDCINYKNKTDLRPSIARVFWLILKDNNKEFENLQPWVDSFFEQQYSRSFYGALELIIEELYGKTSNDTPHKWLLKYIDELYKYSNNMIQEDPLWISLDEVIVKVAETHPEDLANIMCKLFHVWEKSAYIGDLPTLFSSYKKIKNDALKIKTKLKLIEIYNEMKKINSKLLSINFD